MVEQYKLEIYLPPNFNPNHPKGGWFQTGKGDKEWCQHLERLALSNGVSQTKISKME